MFITSNRPGGIGSGLNIWVSTRATTLDPWSTPENLGTPINMDGFSSGSTALSTDGNTLYFFSNRPGGFGMFDLYMSTRQTGGQAAPAAVHQLPGFEPGVVQVLASLSGPENQDKSGNVQVITIGQADSMLPEKTAASLYLAASSPVSAATGLQATDRILATPPSAKQAPDHLGWGTSSESDLLAFNRLGEF
jgi:hypothetical protein